MPWLRLDDGWNTHPKILVLTTSERARWLDVLTTCARHRTGGHVDQGVLNRCGIRPATLTKLTTTLPGERGPLLHELGDGAYQVHNWAIYNSDDVYERVRTALDHRPEMTANDVYRKVGGKREIVLKAYASIVGNPDETKEQPVPGNHPPSVPGNHPSGSPRAQAPSRPHPIGTTGTSYQQHLAAAAAEPLTGDELDEWHQRAAQLDELAAAGWTVAQLDKAQQQPAELERAHGLLLEARADASVRRPGALAWQRFEQGAQPGTGLPASSVAAGAQGSRSSSSRLLPFGPCAVDGCDVRAASLDALEEHRRNVHGEGLELERSGPPAELLRLLAWPPPAELERLIGRPASSSSGMVGEPDVVMGDDEAEVA